MRKQSKLLVLSAALGLLALPSVGCRSKVSSSVSFNEKDVAAYDTDDFDKILLDPKIPQRVPNTFGWIDIPANTFDEPFRVQLKPVSLIPLEPESRDADALVISSSNYEVLDALDAVMPQEIMRNDIKVGFFVSRDRLKDAFQSNFTPENINISMRTAQDNKWQQSPDSQVSCGESELIHGYECATSVRASSFDTHVSSEAWTDPSSQKWYLPNSAKPDEIVKFTGENLSSTSTVTVEGTVVGLTLTSSSSGTFVMPRVRSGVVSVVFSTGSTVLKNLTIISDSAGDGLPIFSGTADQMCSTVSYRNAAGDVVDGTMDCTTAASDCAEDGGTACRATSSYLAVNMSLATSQNIVTGKTIAGVTGAAVARPADCNASGSSNCVTTASVKSATASLFSAGNIKTGFTVGNVTGAYPSSSYPLAGAESSVADLDNATFNAKIKSSTAFEWFSADGTRHSGAGFEALGDAANIKEGVTIFGSVGTYNGVVSSDAVSIRAGTTIGGVTGSLKTNCRNGTKIGTFDMLAWPQDVTVDHTNDWFTVTAHGLTNGDRIAFHATIAPAGLTENTFYYVVSATTNTFQLSTTQNGAAVLFTSNGTFVGPVYRPADGIADIWDTLDDVTLPAIPTANLGSTAWNAANLCGGVDSQSSSADDSNDWQDVSVQAANPSVIEPCSASNHCLFKDEISGLLWTETQATTVTWYAALSLCENLTFAGSSNWRLPTQKELLSAYVHGIHSANSTNWINSDQMDVAFWSSSSQSSGTGAAYRLYLKTGAMTSLTKYSTGHVACVRGG